MDKINKILFWINEGVKKVNDYAKDEKNSEIMIAYYNGYETALKEMKKKLIEIKEEEEECQTN